MLKVSTEFRGAQYLEKAPTSAFTLQNLCHRWRWVVWCLSRSLTDKHFNFKQIYHISVNLYFDISVKALSAIIL